MPLDYRYFFRLKPLQDSTGLVIRDGSTDGQVQNLCKQRRTLLLPPGHGLSEPGKSHSSRTAYPLLFSG